MTQTPGPLAFYGIRETTPGPQWRELFSTTWPAYRRWYLAQGEAARPSLEEGRRRLVSHMPELVPTYERLCELAGDDDLASRFLTLWDPPAFLPGCAQAAVRGGEHGLVRNYDYDPDLCERVAMSTGWSGRRVLGTSDCLWGLVDGMNDEGLVVSLAFGGRPGAAPGFGIPLVVRYLLETTASVDQAQEALSGLPVSMAYNLTVLDRDGEAVTFFVAPGEAVVRFDEPVATNHRGHAPDWPDHARRFRSVERKAALSTAVADRPDLDAVAAAFLAEPLYNTDWARGFGTVYTAVYRPAEGAVEYLWPDSVWRRELDSPSGTHVTWLGGPASVDASPYRAETGGMTGDPTPPASPEVEELAGRARDAVDALAELDDPAAFHAILELSRHVGERLGTSARTLAASRSWSGVADYAGVTRQAAWSRWSR